MSDPFKDFLEELERRRTNGAPQPTEASESEPDSDTPPTRTRARRPGGGAPSGPRPTFKFGLRSLFLPILLVLVLVGGPIIALLTDARWFESLGAGALYWQRLQLQGGLFVAGTLAALALLNLKTAAFGALSLLLYVLIYTPLKAKSPWAVLVGAIPGAIPFMLGWVAATGSFGLEPGVLFAYQFVWQFPHFWAIAWLAYDDYAKAGYYLLPNRIKDRLATRMTVFYALWMVLISLLPAFGLAGTLTTSLWASIATGVLGLDVMYHAVQHFRRADDASARALMFSTIRYLPLVQTLWVVDRFIQ